MVKELGVNNIPNLVLIVVFLNQTQMLLKVTKQLLRENLTLVFLVNLKDFHICTGFQNFINVPLDQDVLSLKQFTVKPFSKALASILTLFFKKIEAHNDK